MQLQLLELTTVKKHMLFVQNFLRVFDHATTAWKYLSDGQKSWRKVLEGFDHANVNIWNFQLQWQKFMEKNIKDK